MSLFKFKRGYSDEVLQEQYQHLLVKFMQMENDSHEVALDNLSDYEDILKRLKKDFVQAFSNDEFKLFYQPQFDCEGNVVGAEGFLRWKHSAIGFIYPPLVIEISKSLEMLDELGLLIFDRAGRDYSILRRHTQSQFKFSINVSAKQLSNPKFGIQIEKICFESGLEPSYFEIDLSENVFQTGSDDIRELVKSMRDFGFRISVKDFGMNESSMRFLLDGLVNTVKLDGKVIKSISDDGFSEEQVKNILNRSNERMYKVVAEQVENEVTFEWLKRHGCHFFQGYFFAPSMSIFDFVRFLETKQYEKMRKI